MHLRGKPHNQWLQCLNPPPPLPPFQSSRMPGHNRFVMESQTAVTAYFSSKPLLLFVFDLQDSLLPSSTGILTAVQRQTAVTAYSKSKRLLLFVFKLQDSLLPSSTAILTAVQRQTAVTGYSKSKQLLLFGFDDHTNKIYPSKHEMLTRCCFNVEPVSQTVDQHWTSTGATSRVAENVLFVSPQRRTDFLKSRKLKPPCFHLTLLYI